jgi:hypothetical protein
LNRWVSRIDGPSELEFTEILAGTATTPGSFAPEAAVLLTIGGVDSFRGNIYSRSQANWCRGVINIGYRCLSQQYAAYQIPVTASDGTWTMVFNLPAVNPNYQVNFAGKSVGDILTIVFAQHSTQLGALGISTDATTTTQLAALTAVPPDPVYFGGNRLWSQVDALIMQWYGSRMCSYIDPTGKIRIIDTLALTTQTVTLGTDYAELDSLVEDTTENFTSVLIRGRSDVEPAYLSLGEGTLIDPHNAAGDNAEATWTLSDFLYPKGSYSTGAVTAQTSTTVTIQSDNALQTIATNALSGAQAQIDVINPLSTTITGFEHRRVTANTAMSAGGTCVVTVDRPLASTGYTRYNVRGQNTNASEAYRRLNIKNTYVAQHLQPQFNFFVPWSPSQGGMTLVNFPVGVICGTTAGVKWQVPAQFEVIPYDGTTNGYLRFYEPWVRAFNSDATLNTGGGAVQQATDIMVLVPYSRGTMTAVYPSSGYAGTAYTRFNVQRQLVREYDSWWDQGSTTAMTTLAEEIHKTVANAVQEGQLTIRDQYLPALTPGAPIALNIANFVGTTGFETMAAPVRTVVLEWMQGTGAAWNTKLSFSTRRQQYSGDRLYVHPAYGMPTGPRLGGNLVTGIGAVGAFWQGMGGEMGVAGDIGKTNLKMLGAFYDPKGQMGGGTWDPQKQDILAQSFANENMAISPVFAPQMGAREMAKLGTMMQAEATATERIGVNVPVARMTPLVQTATGQTAEEASRNRTRTELPLTPFAPAGPAAPAPAEAVRTERPLPLDPFGPPGPAEPEPVRTERPLPLNPFAPE